MLDANQVFLVSGGARGVTARCVIGLAQAVQCQFILFGRTAVDATAPELHYANDTDLKKQVAAYLRKQEKNATPAAIENLARRIKGRDEIKHTLQAIADAGSHAQYISADATSPGHLAAALAATGIGTITGVIHGAGALSDKLIEQKSQKDWDIVYNTKVAGLRSIISCIDCTALEYMVLFSSISGFYGNRGQADYAVANEVLNKFAHAFKQRYPACHTTAFNWGPWDGGMVTPQLKAALGKAGVNVMPLETGVTLFVDTLKAENKNVQILVNDAPPPATSVRQGIALPLHRIRRELDVPGNPFLRDHVIDGKAVLPTACAGAWMANVCLGLQPGYRLLSLSDLRVLKGLVCDDHLPSSFIVEVSESTSDADNCVLSTKVLSETPGKNQRYHYSADICLTRHSPVQTRYKRFDLTEDTRHAHLRPYHDGILFHGPVFQGIRKVLNLSESRITVECSHLTPDFRTQGQFSMLSYNWVCMDLQFQCLGLWIAHHFGASALPLHCRQFHSYQTPPEQQPFYVSVEITEKNEHKVIASIYVHDGEGQLFSCASGAELTVIKRTVRSSNQTNAAPTH